MKRGLRSALVIGFYMLGLVTSLFVGYVGNLAMKVGLLLAGLGLAAGFSYQEHYKPAVRANRKLLRELFEIVLFPRLRQIYRRELADVAGDEFDAEELDEIADDIRINLMVYRRRDYLPWRNDRKLLPWQKSMRIDFCDGDYNEAERELKWRGGEGCCGTALEESDVVYGDLCSSHGDEWGLSSKQQKIANEELGSVLSIPIYRQKQTDDVSEVGDETDGEVVGILNLDTQHCLEETKFDEKAIESVLIKRAQYIGLFL